MYAIVVGNHGVKLTARGARQMRAPCNRNRCWCSRRRMALCSVVLVLRLWLFALVACRIDAAQTFGVSLKGQGFYCGHEAIVFTRLCAANESPCAMQHYWSGGFFPEYGASLLRYYVDSEREASLVLPLGLAHGMAAAMDDNAPWSAGAIMGKSGVGFTGWGEAEAAAVRQHYSKQHASDPVQNTSGAGGSGLFNNFQVPFSKNITVTIEMAGTPKHLVIFWMVLRGRTHATLHLPETPDVLLPPSARLKSYYNPATRLQPLEEFALYNSSSANGAVLLVTLSVHSGPSSTYPSYKYLEGCMRSYSPSGEERFRISSGTEDYFLGTFYFDKGQYFFPEAGVTSLCPPTVPTNPPSIACTPPTTNESKFAAYRLHVAGDPLLFEGGAMQTWRNGDVRGCPWPRGGAPPKDAPVVNASSLALLYEWS